MSDWDEKTPREQRIEMEKLALGTTREARAKALDERVRESVRRRLDGGESVESLRRSVEANLAKKLASMAEDDPKRPALIQAQANHQRRVETAILIWQVEHELAQMD